MPRSDETFIVRVRVREDDAVVEQPRLSRRRRVRDVSEVGALIVRWLAPPPARDVDHADDGSAVAKPPDEPITVLKISDTSKPGDWSFDTKKLTAKAGKVTIELQNDSGLGHNVRVHTGKCCFKPGYRGLGGTAVIGAKKP